MVVIQLGNEVSSCSIRIFRRRLEASVLDDASEPLDRIAKSDVKVFMLQFICKFVYVLARNFLHSLVHHGVGRRILGRCWRQDFTAELVKNGPHVLWALVTHFVDHNVKRLVQEGISWSSDALHDFGAHLSIIWYIQQRVALFAKLIAPLLSAFWTFNIISQCKDSCETWSRPWWCRQCVVVEWWLW